MNLLIKTYILWLILMVITITCKKHSYFSINEHFVCDIKRSCLECLRLSQCSWCEAENRCFSRKLPKLEDYCKNNSTQYQNHGLSFVENAKCACAGGHLEEKCVPDGGDSTGLKCSGRGACLCGRCVCNPMPDPEHPNKMVLGEYCEYDNFSCDGPRCNEGPFHYMQNKSHVDTGLATPPEQ